jgi:hypothetical protein
MSGSKLLKIGPPQTAGTAATLASTKLRDDFV